MWNECEKVKRPKHPHMLNSRKKPSTMFDAVQNNIVLFQHLWSAPRGEELAASSRWVSHHNVIVPDIRTMILWWLTRRLIAERFPPSAAPYRWWKGTMRCLGCREWKYLTDAGKGLYPLGSSGWSSLQILDRRYAIPGQLGTMWLLAGVQQLRVLRMSHCFTLVSPSLSHLPAVVLLWVLCLVGVFVCFSGFASARVVFLVSTSRVLDDRQCFTARSARQKKRS